MLDIKLINMPFAALNIPSIALTQLRAVLHQQFGEKVTTRVHYLNHDFGTFLSRPVYEFISGSVAGHVSGFGEWFFRQAAFPELEENTREYFDRYGSHFQADGLQMFELQLKPKRARLMDFLDDLIDSYRMLDSDVIGFSSMFFQNLPSIALARRLKERKPELILVIGGANCEAPMGIELAAHVEPIDFVFSGHSLISFPRFIHCLLEGNEGACHSLNGVFSKKNCRSQNLRGKSGHLMDVDPEGGVRPIGDERSIEGPAIALDYDSFLKSHEKHFPDSENRPYLLFETSRGCWWGQRSHCTFCGLNGGTMMFRHMEEQVAYDHLNDLFERYSSKVDHFSSVDNIIPKSYIQEVFPRLRVPDNVSMFYEVKADLSSEDMETLAHAHVYEIQPGIESLSTSTLKLMRKGTTSFNNINFLKNCLLHGIHPVWNLLIGFPGETRVTYEKYLRDLQHLAHLIPPEGVFPVRFDRFSPYFNQKDSYGLDLQPLTHYELCYPFDQNVLANLAYYFEDRNFNAAYIQETSRYLQPLNQMVSRWRALWAPEVDRPELYFKDIDYSNGIFDSREGSAREFQIGDEAKDVLLSLERPKTSKRIVRELDHLSPEEVAAGIAEADERNLIFHEGESMLNLVLPYQPLAVPRALFHV